MSLTSVVCKLLETLIEDHMVEFLVKCGLMNASEHGSLETGSCLTSLLCCLEEVSGWLDDGSPVEDGSLVDAGSSVDGCRVGG